MLSQTFIQNNPLVLSVVINGPHLISNPRVFIFAICFHVLCIWSIFFCVILFSFQSGLDPFPENINQKFRSWYIKWGNAHYPHRKLKNPPKFVHEEDTWGLVYLGWTPVLNIRLKYWSIWILSRSIFITRSKVMWFPTSHRGKAFKLKQHY